MNDYWKPVRGHVSKTRQCITCKLITLSVRSSAVTEEPHGVLY